MNPSRGVVDSGMVGWWHAANALEVLVQAVQVVPTRLWPTALHDEILNDVLPRMFEMQNTSGILDSHSYDDSAWVSLAWLRAFELTGNQSYLERATKFYEQILHEAWDETCGGGFYWAGDAAGGGLRYKNAITNELFIVLALRLRQHAPDAATAEDLLSWAQRNWQWFNNSGMLHEHCIADGLSDNCTCNHNEGYTYNQGVILAGLGLLHAATPPEERQMRASLIAAGDGLAAAVFKPGSRYSVDGVLREPCETDGCDSNGAQFKGIFTRYLRQYLDAVGSASPGHAEFHQLLARNAESVWATARRAPAIFGLHWAGPAPAEDFPADGAILQTSALGALLAALPPLRTYEIVV